MSFRLRLRHELSLSGFFDLTEPSSKIIKVADSFTPERKYQATIIVRVTFLIFALVAFFLQLRRYVVPGNGLYFLFYLTHWTLFTGMAYLVSAIYVTLHRDDIMRQEESGNLLSSVKLMWTLFSISAPAGVSVFLAYWPMAYNPAVDTIDFRNCMVHGGVASLVLIDGLIIGSIPLRIKQILFYYGYCFSYVIFNIIHDYSPLGDGDREGEGDDEWEDSLYKVLSWSTDFKTALKITVIQFLVVNPTVYFLCWGLSLIRRQTVTVSNSNKASPLIV